MKCFFDTNVLIYQFDYADSFKQSVAEALVKETMRRQKFVIITQVMQEFFSVATCKLKPSISAADAQSVLAQWAQLDVVTVTPSLILETVDVAKETRLSWWDALIIRSAQWAGCSILYSEDMQHGQTMGGLRIENPFRLAVNEPSAPAYLR